MMTKAEPVPADLAAFLRGEVDNANFHHADHVRMAYEILKRHDFPEALLAYSSALKAIVARAGVPGVYHETITVAFLSLVAERSAGSDHADFEAFAASNPDLMRKSALERWYGAERLGSDVARRTFVLPSPASP